MHHLRRVVTILTSLALLQLTVLGSTIPCATPMPQAGPHAEHASHAGGLHATEVSVDAGSATRDWPPSSDCVVRACAGSPVLLVSGEIAPPALQAAGGVAPVAHEKPASPVQQLETPPPRA